MRATRKEPHSGISERSALYSIIYITAMLEHQVRRTTVARKHLGFLFFLEKFSERRIHSFIHFHEIVGF